MSRRRENGEGSIYYSEADGKWHGWVTVGVKPDGRLDRRHRVAPTEAAVRAKVRELLKQKAAGKVRKAGRPPTVEQWMTTFLDTVCARKVEDGSMAPRTLDDYRSKVALYVIPGIGKHRIDRLTPDHLDQLYLELLRRPLASSTVLKVHRIISRALKVAFQRGTVAENVALKVDAPSAEEVEIEPLTKEEARAVLDVAERRRNGARWSVALAMGLRQGEALGLRWQYVDLDEGVMRVWWQLQRLTWQHGCDDPHACGAKHHRKACRAGCTAHKAYKRGCPKPCPKDCTGHAKACPQRKGGGLVFRPPKGKNRRTVPIPPPLVALLRAHRASQLRERLAAGNLWEENDLVFCQPNGKPIDPRRDWAEWGEILAAAGVEAKRVHDGRHTAATLLVENGVGLRVVMELLGHSQMRVTQRYSHVSSALAEEAASKVGKALWG
ncbi:site-specific integrase [Streptomyces sp. WAC00469]|uniref:tyrosine-type recombinase/integrase n=1 Tax=Streptomyces sp. WAC00469 TaxID=2487415 RepID=UPI0021B06AC1|nr:site-specific integrase [Streptomyces sp. WAC00469]